MTKKEGAERLTAELQECIGKFFQRKAVKQEEQDEIKRSFISDILHIVGSGRQQWQSDGISEDESVPYENTTATANCRCH